MLALLFIFFAAATRAPPGGFVDLSAAIPHLRVAIGYATKDNFTGAPLPGYGAAGAWLLAPVATALAQVQSDVEKDGLGLLVYDAYRPERASRAMFDWAKRQNRTDLFDHGYIALHSGHNHGHTVDLTLIDVATGIPLDMGTPWDTLDARANTKHASGEQLAHRLRLRKAMTDRGFVPYDKEWWHFSFPLADTLPHDTPYGSNE